MKEFRWRVSCIWKDHEKCVVVFSFTDVTFERCRTFDWEALAISALIRTGLLLRSLFGRSRICQTSSPITALDPLRLPYYQRSQIIQIFISIKRYQARFNEPNFIAIVPHSKPFHDLYPSFSSFLHPFYYLFVITSKEIIYNISIKYYFDLLFYFTTFHSHGSYIPLIYKILTYPF
jgi:hypothetical protein